MRPINHYLYTPPSGQGRGLHGQCNHGMRRVGGQRGSQMFELTREVLMNEEDFHERNPEPAR